MSRATIRRFAGLGVILQDIGEDKRALEAFRRALDINPHMENIPELVRRLKLEGRRPGNLIRAAVVGNISDPHHVRGARRAEWNAGH